MLSLQQNVALRWCRKLLVFDEVPTPEEIEHMKMDRRFWEDVVRGPKWERMWNEKREAYAEYRKAVIKMIEKEHVAFHRVQAVVLDRFGHLYGTLRAGLSIVTTPYVLITQHDLKLVPRFVAADVQRTLEVMRRGEANYIVLNRDMNNLKRTSTYFKLVEQFDREFFTGRMGLTAMAGFSDQCHFAVSSWYRENVWSTFSIHTGSRHGMRHFSTEGQTKGLLCMISSMACKWSAIKA